jgi:hypothetical protein
MYLAPFFLANEILDKKPWDPMLAAGVIVVVGLAPLVVTIGNRIQQKRTERLKEEFGPDYDDVLNEIGNRHKAEKLLQQRLLERLHKPGDDE